MTRESIAAPPLSALLARGRPLVMGILNVTPDSFSDGGNFADPQVAVAHAREMVAAGADIIDIGAESTRPYGGALPVSAAEERARLAPVLATVVSLGVPVSIDTMKSDVAEWALRQGASILNDVWGLQRDPGMAHVAAAHGAPVIAMHNRDTADPAIDIMADIEAFFARSVEIARRAGVRDDDLILDPGIGFGKTPEQSILVLAQLDRLRRLGFPLLLGASRKRFIAMVSPAEPQQRIGGSIAAALYGAEHGAAILRVHDVVETVQALKVIATIKERQ